jgi:hypothetical protein
LRVVEQLQVKKSEAKDHIGGHRGFASGARNPCRSPRGSRRGDRGARRGGRGCRVRKLDVTPAPGHVIMNPVICISEPGPGRRKRRHARGQRIAGGFLTRRVGVHFDPEDRMPVLEVRAELAAKNPVIVWLEVVLVLPLVVVLLIVALA